MDKSLARGILAGARELFVNGPGWTKGTWARNPYGGNEFEASEVGRAHAQATSCLDGGLIRAAMKLVPTLVLTGSMRGFVDVNNEAISFVRVAVANAIVELFPDRTNMSDSSLAMWRKQKSRDTQDASMAALIIPAFNDNGDTTLEDVEKVIELAEKSLEDEADVADLSKEVQLLITEADALLAAGVPDRAAVKEQQAADRLGVSVKKLRVVVK